MNDKDKEMQRLERLERVNELIVFIGRLGRRFFYSKSKRRYAQMYMNDSGRLFWLDDYTGKLIYLHYKYWGKASEFSHGGTMRHLINMLKRYVMTGELLPQVLGPWPEEFCNGDLWGYGKENMELIRKKAQELGLLPS